MRTWFTSNHDENSWNGTEFEKYGDLAKTLAVFSFTWNGIPLLYSGQEIPNKKRLEFFEKDELVWEIDPAYFNFYKTLLLLKNNNPALRGGDPHVQTFRIKTNNPDAVIAYLRKKDEHEILVILNFSPAEPHVELDDEMLNGKYISVFDETLVNSNLKLKPYHYLVFQKVS
jgi:glycosidase